MPNQNTSYSSSSSPYQQTQPPQIQLGGVPIINLNSPAVPQYPSQEYPQSYQAQQHVAQQDSQQHNIYQPQPQKPLDRNMSVEMADVGGLSLSSNNPSPVYGFTPHEQDIPEGKMMVPGRQPSAEEERLKDKVREAQEQVRDI
jgi:hypothetical protein